MLVENEQMNGGEAWVGVVTCSRYDGLEEGDSVLYEQRLDCGEAWGSA